MNEFPPDIQFKYVWRKYQQRVLDGLEEYLQDDHLHVIAPPGSGKTILGLEVVRLINQPVLILAPTIAIRNQWIQKFCELFLQTDEVPGWISRDVRKPRLMTVITYQGLHAACNDLRVAEHDYEHDEEVNGEEILQSDNSRLDDIANGLIAKKVKTIVIDEAHHLKNEWWQTLTKIKERLDPITIGLTATPPYDVSPNEWQRYVELNGPVDVEISVPELVIEGDLCPHQDYVYLSLPTQSEYNTLVSFRAEVEATFNELKSDAVLITAIQNHPAWLSPGDNLDWIYSNLACYSACLIYLNANDIAITESHLEIIDDKDLTIPDFDYAWAEILLDFYLYKEKIHFKNYKDHQKQIENKLRRCGAIDKHQICFSQNQQITSSLKSSISKLDGIAQIVDFEYKQLGTGLRMVVLTDYIRKEFYADITQNNFELNKIGVLTIFEKLRRNNSSGIKIGVLTGSVVIIPKSAYANFLERIAVYKLKNIVCKAVPFDEDYVLVEECEQLKNDIVNIITQIFQDGGIEVLVGTKSLLGEGWDAPSINSLILASFVGSFVLSNQMRGRAIRSQKNNLEKTGNIWHLCCVDPTTISGGDDVDMLRRRFKGFVGVSLKNDPGIENGIGRLTLPIALNKYTIEVKNEQTFTDAGNRKSLAAAWKTALEKGVTLVEEIKMPFDREQDYQAIKRMYFNKTISNLFATLGFGLLDYALGFLQSFGRGGRMIRTRDDLYIFLALFGIIGAAIFGRLAYKAFKLYLKYRDIAKDIQNIGNALLNTMVQAGIIKTSYKELSVDTSIDKYGAVYCHLDGGTTFERSSFINMLQEVVKPIDNPRYVIIRKSLFMRFIKQRDYHTVPELLGRNKRTAVYFEEQWRSLVGRCDLIFTRTIEGRRMLLKSRLKSLSAQFENSSERISKWK